MRSEEEESTDRHDRMTCEGGTSKVEVRTVAGRGPAERTARNETL